MIAIGSGHGHTADIGRPLSYEQMAEDTFELLRQLKVTEAEFFGFSDGGVIALRIASQHPALVKKLVTVGSSYNNDGLYPEVLEAMKNFKAEDMPPMLHDAYVKAAPKPENWPTLVAKVMKMD